MRSVFLFLTILIQDPFATTQHRDANVIPMTLAAIEAEALANNPEVLLAASRIASAEAQLPTAMAQDDPVAMYRGWGVPAFEPWNLNQVQHMFMVTQNFAGAGKRELRYLTAVESVDIVKLQLESKKREVVARVRLAFFELLRTYDELRLHDEQVELARQSIAAARIKYTVGKVPQQDVLKAQIALTRLIDHLVMFEQDGDLARAELNSLMGRDPSAPLEVEGEFNPIQALPPTADLQKLAEDHRVELAALQAAIQQGETKSKLAAKAYTPDFSIGAGYMLMPAGSSSRNAYMAEFSMTIPWLDRGKHDAEIQQARLEVQALRSEYQIEKAKVLQQVREARIHVESAQRLVELYRDTLRPQAEVALHATTTAYETDQTDLLNVLDSQNTTLDVQYAYFGALAEYNKRLAELEQAVGGLQ